MTIQDKARVITRDTRNLIPSHIRHSCQRIIIGKALKEPIDRRDTSLIGKIYRIHYAKRLQRTY